MTLDVCHLGPTAYRDGLRLQEALVQARAAGRTGDWLLYPDHPPVLTVGRGGSEASLKVDRATLGRMGIEVFEVARGGDFTWHGPGQLVGYVVCDLTARDRDLHRFLRDLERTLIAALAGWGLNGETVAGRTGVWVGGEKIASLGVAVRRWVSYHGFALNVAPDLSSFDVIHPCGLRGIHMTSLARRLGPAAPALADARTAVATHLARQLGYANWQWRSAAEAHRAATPVPGGTDGRRDSEQPAGAAR
jgi:lipoyl(octanoyl) transferase